MWSSLNGQLLEQKWDMSHGIHRLSNVGSVGRGGGWLLKAQMCWRFSVVPRDTVFWYSTFCVSVDIADSSQSKNCESFSPLHICVGLNNRGNKTWTLISCLLTTGSYGQQERKPSCQTSIAYGQQTTQMRLVDLESNETAKVIFIGQLSYNLSMVHQNIPKHLSEPFRRLLPFLVTSQDFPIK